MVDMIKSNRNKPKITAVERFKINLEKHFVTCARNNNLWEAFTEFKQKTENDEIFANIVKSPEQKKQINKVILDAFYKIDTSKTKYKYYHAISKLKKRFQNGFDLFSNSYIDNSKSPFMDNIMQEIIDRDISFLSKNDRQHFCDLFDILGDPEFKTQDEKLKAFDEINKKAFPNNSKKGKFGSSKVADKFRHLNELCKRISNCQSFIISSTALNTKGLSFEQALDKFRLDLKKRYIPSFEVANMYSRSLGTKPLDIAAFINKQEELFVDAFRKMNPNISINYSKPNLDKVYPFVKFSMINAPKLSGVTPVRKSSISENLKRSQLSLQDLTKKASKASKEFLFHPNKFIKNKLQTTHSVKSKTKDVAKNIVKSFETKEM